MRVLVSALVIATAAGCSLRGTDGLQEGRGGAGGAGTAGGAGGSGGVGGAGAAGGAGGCGADLMTSLEHCGACDNPCSPGPCVDGSCVIYEAEGLTPIGIVSDSDHVYVGGRIGLAAAILKHDLSGANGFETLFTGATDPGLADLVLSGDFLHLLDVSGEAIYQVHRDSGAAVGSWEMILGSFFLAATPDLVCWTDVAGVSCSLQGSPPETIVPTAMQTPFAAGLAVVGGEVIYVDADKAVQRVTATPGATPAPLGTVTGIFVWDVSFDPAANALFIHTTDGIFRGGAQQGGEPIALLRPVEQEIGTGLVHGEHYYWTTRNVAGSQQGRLSRIPREWSDTAPPPVDVLWEGERTPGFATVRDGQIYFTLSESPRGQKDRIMRRSLEAEPLFVE